MLSVVGRTNLNNLVKATSHSVNSAVKSIPVYPKQETLVPFNPDNANLTGLPNILNKYKSVSISVNAFNQVRYAHTDIKIPDFTDVRRKGTKDSNTSSRLTADDRRGFTYLITASTAIGGALLAKASIRGVVGYLNPSKDLLALAKIEVDLSEIPMGKNVVVKWRGNPVFIKHRSSIDIERERAVDVNTLRHPQTDEERTQDPEWLVMIGVCTHLGCIPIYGKGDYPGGYYCPCHGSHYDGSGRIRKGPAPMNLEVPQYEIQGNLLVVG